MALVSLPSPAFRLSTEVWSGWQAIKMSLLMMVGVDSCPACLIISFAALSNIGFLIVPLLVAAPRSRPLLVGLLGATVLGFAAAIAAAILVSDDPHITITLLPGYFIWLIAYVSVAAGLVRWLMLRR